MSLKYGDLNGTILPKISIDEYEPKAGNHNDVIVVAFYANDNDPAEDLNTFIQRGSIDTLDVEVSPNTDENGSYLIFVEMQRNDTFPNKFQALIKDVENVTGKEKWRVKTYLSDNVEFDFNDPELFNFLVLEPENYVTKDEFKMKSIDESIRSFFKDSMITGLTIIGRSITIAGSNSKIIAEVVDVGSYDVVISRNYLTESAFGVSRVPQEAKVLQRMIGNGQVLPLGKYLCVNVDDNVLLLNNTEISYGR